MDTCPTGWLLSGLRAVGEVRVGYVILGITLGCVGSMVLYGLVLPRIRHWGERGREARIGWHTPRTGRRTVRRLASSRQLLAGGLIVLAFAIVAIGAPLVAPPEGEDPYIMPSDGLGFSPKPPSAEHPLGTTQSQADVLYGLIWGTRGAFKLSLIVTLGRTVLGVIVGLISGYYGGLIDGLIMRVTDAFLAFRSWPRFW